MKILKLFKGAPEKSCHTGCQSNDAGSKNCRILVLGSGCKKCHELYENVQAAAYELGIHENIGYITDLKSIAEYGAMSTPALVIDHKIVSAGKILKPVQIKEILESIDFPQERNDC